MEWDAKGNLSSRELMICTAALLLEVAHADNSLDPSEINAMALAMQREFEVGEQDAGDVMEVADYLRSDSSRVAGVVKMVNERFSLEQKQTIGTMLCSIMLADGITEDAEKERICRIGNQLGLSQEEMISCCPDATCGQ